MGVQQPAPDTDVSEEPPGLTVSGVARRLGVAPATLRTWDRRYGLGPSEHSAGAHRRYSAADVERLAAMRRLVLEGVAPGEAARSVLSAAAPVEPGEGAHQHSPGGGSLALPGAEPVLRGLARAALAHDAATCTDMVRRMLTERGAVETWTHLVTPVLVALGERWAATGRGVDVEHLFSEAVLGAMRSYVAAGEPSVVPRPVLLSCAEEEQHALPLHALAASLAERRVSARILGARVPRQALADMVTRTAPAALFIWSQRHATGHLDQLDALPTLRPPVPLFLGGQGWPALGLPRTAHVLSDLTTATDVLAATAGA